MYRAVYRYVFLVLLCICNPLKLYGDAGLCNGFHAVNSGSNPLGDANRHLKAHHIPQKLRFCGAPFVL